MHPPLQGIHLHNFRNFQNHQETFDSKHTLFKGKNAWHYFEKKYLNYFLDPLCGFAQWDYTKIINDKRVFRNSLSWETDKYLKAKNIDWERLI